MAEEAARWRATNDQPGLICAAYDAELFGHWWFEGVQWLARVLELAWRRSAQSDVATATAGGYVAAHPGGRGDQSAPLVMGPLSHGLHLEQRQDGVDVAD